MKSIGTRFLVPFGLLAVLGSVFVLYQTYQSSRRHAEELLSQQAAIALEFNLAIRDYAGQKIRPAMEKLAGKDTFDPATMSTSYISRRIFEEVQQRFPDYIIRFSSENPRNPVNLAGPDERRIIEFFRQNPQVKRLTEEINIEGKPYLANFSSRWFRPECMQCHGDPREAPVELVEQYGDTAGFHRQVGDVAGLDVVAVPMTAITASLISNLRSPTLILAAALTLLFVSIFLIFRFVVTRRLVAMAQHFDAIAAPAEGPWMTPVAVTGNDEISVVGVAFNKLVEQLRASRASLEQRVIDRTEELRQANEQLQAQLRERQQAEAALQKSEEKYRNLMETASDAIFAADGETGIIIDANQKTAELLGLPPDQIIGRHQSELHPPEEADRYQKIFQSHAAGGGLVGEDIYVVNAAGRRIPVEINASVTEVGNRRLVVGIFRDISERKRAEEELRSRQAELTSIFRAVPVGIGMTVNRIIQEVNDRVCHITGYSREELIGHSARMLYPTQEDFDFVGLEKYRQILRQGVGTMETRWRRRDGVIIDVLLSSTPIMSGNVSQKVLFTVMDITERKRMEAEHYKIDKLESLGIMAGGIAHDFNNVLMTILGNISLAALDGAPADIADRLKNAEKGCQQAMVLAKQLLTFAKGGVPIKEPHRVADILEEAAGLALSGSKSRYEFACPENLWNVQVDRGQIHQVFSNLLINSDQAMPLGGVVSIRAENVEYEDSAASPLPGGRYVLVTLTDQGVGIPAGQLGKIFDPYFTTKQKGNGLGLATAYSIVTQHGGLISVASTLGAGTTFRVYLPAVAAPVTVNDQQETEPPAGQGRVLVMDDEAMVREVVGKMLKRLGYAPVFAREGKEALELFAEALNTREPFAAVILDLTIPGGMGGEDVIHHLRALDPGVKAVVSSGYADDGIMADYQALGFQGVIAKPYTIAQLGEALKKVIAPAYH